MPTIIRGVQDRRFQFVQLLNSMFNDSKLSLKAKGFIGYCLVNKQDFNLHMKKICKDLKEGESAIYSVVNECISLGYAYRCQLRDEKGRMLPLLFYISDSKYEIEKIKSEIESSEQFKKSLPNRENPEPAHNEYEPVLGFPEPDSSEPENSEPEFPKENEGVYNNNTNVNNTQQQQRQPVVVVPAAPKDFCKSDAHSIAMKKGWSYEEVEEAWEAYEKNKNKELISSKIEYLGGIIDRIRLINASKNKKGKKCQTSQSPLQQEISPEKPPTLEVHYLGNVTTGQYLQNLLEEQKKRSPYRNL